MIAARVAGQHNIHGDTWRAMKPVHPPAGGCAALRHRPPFVPAFGRPAGSCLTEQPRSGMLFPDQETEMSKAIPKAASEPSGPFPERAMAIGEYVRSRREAHDMSLRQLAELAGVGVRFLLELEHGKPTMRMNSVNAVLAVFGKRLGIVEKERD